MMISPQCKRRHVCVCPLVVEMNIRYSNVLIYRREREQALVWCVILVVGHLPSLSVSGHWLKSDLRFVCAMWILLTQELRID
jgi:hypothetical protein